MSQNRHDPTQKSASVKVFPIKKLFRVNLYSIPERNFGKSSSWGQKYPGKMIKSMAMYEVFYASKLYSAKKPIKRFKENKYKKEIFSKKKRDEEAIRSLFGMNKGRKNMREALGMDMETPTKEAIQKFWLLGEFLELGTPIDNKIEVNKDIKERQDKLDVYKSTISTLKKKLEERAEEKKSLKDKSWEKLIFIS